MRYFPIYIDILGFEERAKDDARKTGLDAKDIRLSYINSVERRFDELKKSGVVAFYNKSSESDYSDEWLAFSGDIWNAFKSVGEVLKAKLPLAVAMGVIEINEKYLAERSNETISYLKTHIITKYRKIYKDKHYGTSPEQTFILLTPEAYEQLDSKRKCLKPDPEKEYYLIEQKEFEEELKSIFFLEKIGSQRSEYREIEELYTKPENYDLIKETLEKQNIVLIIGDAEMGKTYTAIRLLREYFNVGYEPVYLHEERRSDQWEFIRHKTEFDGKVIYLEDPWGKVEFEKAESLYREIGIFISDIKRKPGKIIVTSREKVFLEFDKRKEISDDLWKYVNSLKVNLAYSNDNLAKMLEKYIAVFEPVWATNEELKKIAFEAVGKKMQTPMSIRNFVVNSKIVETTKELETEIEKVSTDTKIAFANEIKEMFKNEEFDKIVFLSFPYIYLEPYIAKSCYEGILKDIGCNLINTRNYSDLIKVFNNEVEVWINALRYAHPSYWDAFASAMTDNGVPNNISKKLFYRVLLKLSEKNEAAGTIIRAIVENFDKLPEEARNLLFKLSEKDYVSYYVEEVIIRSFHKIPEDIRNELLLKLSEKDKVSTTVPQILAIYFDKLPENVRNLLFKFSDKDEVAIGVAWGIGYNFDRISEDIRNELLLKLSEKEKAAKVVIDIIAENFDKLPENVRNLLFKLSEKEEFVEIVAKAIAENFDKLPENVRNLLFKFCKNDEIAWNVVWAIAEDFNKNPDDIENKFQLFNKLLERDTIAWNVTEAITHNFYKIPADVRNELLIILSEKDKTSEMVVRVISHHFYMISGDVRDNLLLKLSEKENAARAVARVVALNFDKIPEDVRNKLLLKLSKNKTAVSVVGRIIAKNYNKFPESMKMLIAELHH